MYKIIGADNNEYGPVSAEQLREWIAQGRVGPQTQVQAEGGEWKPAANHAEFAGAFVAPPPSFSSAAAPLAQGDYQIDIGGCISAGWDLMKKNFGLVFVGVLAYFAIALLMGLLSGIPFIGPLFSIVNFIIGGPLLGGLYYLFLRAIRRDGAEVGDIFSGFRRAFFQLFLGQLVPALLVILCFIPAVVVGLITAWPSISHHTEPEPGQIVIIVLVGIVSLVPAIFLQVNWIYTIPLIVDRQMDFSTAMKTSWQRVRMHWWQNFGLLVLVGLINILGVLACCVGVLFTITTGFGAMMFAYETIFSDRKPQGS